MNPDEDPEARIRQLEQQQAQHGAVELGTQSTPGVDPTMQLPPPVYTDPYPQSSPYTAPPFGVSYPHVVKKTPYGLIFGLIGVAVVIVVGVIGAVVWKVTSDVGSISTTQHGETNFAGPRSAAPTFAPPVLPGPPIAPTEESPQVVPPGGQLSVAGVDNVELVDCNGGHVSVSGVNNAVTITGHCVSLTVSGVDNQVTVDSADQIGASGFDNQVIYHSGNPQIDATSSNSVSQG